MMDNRPAYRMRKGCADHDERDREYGIKPQFRSATVARKYTVPRPDRTRKVVGRTM